MTGELTKERMLISRMKRLLLVLPGVLNLAWWFVAQEGKRHGIQVRRNGKVVDLHNYLPPDSIETVTG